MPSPQLYVSRSRVPILLDARDSDLAAHTWYLHDKGYVYRRPTESDASGRRVRRMIWLHKVVAQRAYNLPETPGWVWFRNKNPHDCRRRNLLVASSRLPKGSPVKPGRAKRA